LLSKTLGAWAPESEIADILRQAEKDHEGCQIGSYPFFLVVRSTEVEALAICAAELKVGLEEAGYEVTEGGI